MCNPRQEGHNDAKRHAAFATNQRGISLHEQLCREMKCSDACLDPNHNGNLHNQLTPLIRWGKPIMRSGLQTIMCGHLIVGYLLLL